MSDEDSLKLLVSTSINVYLSIKPLGFLEFIFYLRKINLHRLTGVFYNWSFSNPKFFEESIYVTQTSFIDFKVFFSVFYYQKYNDLIVIMNLLKHWKVERLSPKK